jgi:sulfur relay (sulfurtransferase) DsrC/TusE family protein
MKNKGSKQGSKQGSSPYLLDRNLTPRIEQYALNHDITDTDEVVDYLRRSYKEYQRRPVAALRQMVVKAVQVVQRKGVAKPELVLQVTSFIGVAILGDSTAGSTCTGQSAASSCCICYYCYYLLSLQLAADSSEPAELIATHIVEIVLCCCRLTNASRTRSGSSPALQVQQTTQRAVQTTKAMRVQMMT